MKTPSIHFYCICLFLLGLDCLKTPLPNCTASLSYLKDTCTPNLTMTPAFKEDEQRDEFKKDLCSPSTLRSMQCNREKALGSGSFSSVYLIDRINKEK